MCLEQYCVKSRCLQRIIEMGKRTGEKFLVLLWLVQKKRFLDSKWYKIVQYEAGLLILLGIFSPVVPRPHDFLFSILNVH